MFDFHIHIARLPQKKQLTQLLCDRKYDFVAVACEPREWNEVALLKKEFSTEFKPFMVSYGIHPMIATQADEEMFAKLRDFLIDDEHAMVGEAGIDKRYPGYEDGTQDQVFLEQAKLAVEFRRDLQIHCVGDYMRVLKLLIQAGFPQESTRPIFHRFGGDLNVVKKAIPYGALFSLHSDSFRKKSTVAAIPHIPQERVFFETDADETFNTRHPRPDRGSCECKEDPGTHSARSGQAPAGMTRKNETGKTNENAAEVTCYTPEEILAELESRIESVRTAYAKCRE